MSGEPRRTHPNADPPFRQVRSPAGGRPTADISFPVNLGEQRASETCRPASRSITVPGRRGFGQFAEEGQVCARGLPEGSNLGKDGDSRDLEQVAKIVQTLCTTVEIRVFTRS